MIKMRKLSLIRTLTLLSVVFLSVGCGTISPDPIKSTESSYDASTPSQYDPKSSGFLGFTENEKGETTGALLSDNAVKKYNALITDYAIQFKNEEKVSIDTNAGVRMFVDGYGNAVHWIDAEHLQYFLKLNRWRKEKREPDTIWMKLRDKI